jgi:SagB-type dehydrogenase family enzyme
MGPAKLAMVLALFAAAPFVAAGAFAQDIGAIKLPVPDMKGGMPLMEALKQRRTQRDFSGEELSQQMLSNLLWAAFGINRPEAGLRTAPSAMNMQEIAIYVALKQGLYLYNAKDHSLEPVLAEDIRAKTGGQGFVADAPVNLVFVADYSKMRGSQANKDFYSAADTGFIGQNVYLYCASEGLATVVRGALDRELLAKAMKLRDDQKIILAQTVGHPKTE